MSVYAGLLAQGVAASGTIRCSESGEPLEFATIFELNTRIWTTSDAEGRFTITHLPKGASVFEIRSFGYATLQLPISLYRDTLGIEISLHQESLKLDSVTVMAQRVAGSSSSHYLIDRSTLDHMQMLNVSDITALLPGGKTDGSRSLLGDDRIALRSNSSQEMGNQSFGTAIEVDGVRLQQNGRMSIIGASTRSIAASNIASVEVVTGIPSVEFGDLSNGIVRIKTRQTQSPYIAEFTTKPHTKMLSLCKGWLLGDRQNYSAGILNASFEHARSVSNLTSPYTAYQRNVLTLSYNKALANRVRLHSSLTGNVGGYNSKNDPDAFTDTWSKVRDYVIRAKTEFDWSPERPWLSRLSANVCGSISDQRSETKSNHSSASALAQIHSAIEGYHVATDYEENPEAPILLSPTGYWYRNEINDNKPYSFSAQVKGEWNYLFRAESLSAVACHIKAGASYDLTGNNGRGTYFTDMRVAPTWREARYDTLPAQHVISAYIEPRISVQSESGFRFSITPGLRQDVSVVKTSDYGVASAPSPRISARFESSESSWVDEHGMKVALFGGWGKSVKLPSMQVLYPATTYQDQLAFAPGSMQDGRSYLAYYTHPSRAIYNKNLRWQYSIQREIGIEWQWAGNRFSLSAYDNTSHRPYISTSVYTPYSYRFTTQADLNSSQIPSSDRTYSIDHETGIVTVSDRTGIRPDEVLLGTMRNAYLSNTKYINGSSSRRLGLEWILDLARIKALHTDIRIDGNLTRYRGVETSLIAYRPSSTLTMSDGLPYAYIGYFEGSTTAGNGLLSRQFNTNVTVSTHIPAVRLILSVRLEGTFINSSQRLQTHAIVLDDSQAGGFIGQHSSELSGHYVAVYPRYYSTWQEPDKLIPFEEAFLKAQTDDPELFHNLSSLVARTNTNYFFNGNRISPYFCGNLNITKEIGDHVTLSFQATNFWNHTGTVHSSQTKRRNTLYGSGYIPSFYYGMNIKFKY